jgi:UDP-GlcNAc:undecaprenyl-phosphate GlcNAc-1-phosphate transferase
MRIAAFFLIFTMIVFTAGNLLNIETYLIYHFMGVMLIVASLTKLSIIYARNLGFVDSPSVRKMHKKPTPSIGGMVFIPITLISWIIKMSDNIDEKIFSLSFSILLMFILGLIDDRKPLSHKIKLPLQILASIIVIHYWKFIPLDFGGALGITTVGEVWGWILMIAFFQFTINAINYMDGINGLLGGYLVLVFSFLYLWSGSIELMEIKHILASTIAGILAFLYFNFRRTAETFMGDAGSTVLGLIAATATTRIIQIVPTSSFLLGDIDYQIPAFFIFVIIFWYPLFDSLQVYARRVIRGNSPFIADRLHVHHWLMLKTNKNHLLSSLYIIGITAAVLFGMSLSL